MTLLIRAICVAISALVTVPLYAQSNPDIDAAARSVVRVVVLAPDETGTREALGMGSGVAISPTRIITNAHVVEAAVERGGFVGIVPSEGRKRYVGEVVAYSAALDLAIIALKSGSITPATIYTGAVSDGMGVAALGYPYGVDRAMASGVDDVIRPQSPVKSLGNVGGLRRNERFDTVLHDAAIGRGNSGGPLLDTCGRIIGINSFLSISEGIDSTFAFAITAREVIAFLAKSKVAASIATTPCLSQGDVAAREAALTRADNDAAAMSAKRAEGNAAKAAAEKQRLRDDIIGERENGMALAAGLFGLGLVGAVGGIVLYGRRTKQQRRFAPVALALGGIAMLGAVFVFLTRPKLSDVEDRYAAAHPAMSVKLVSPEADNGAKICVFNAERSRVTVSKTDNVPIKWEDSGCVNGKMQYGAKGGVWSRTFVPNTEATITIQSYDPAKTRYTVERYLMGADAIEKARAIRARYKNNACTPDPAQQRSVADMETAIRAVMPQAPNERIVFDCQSSSGG
jgi:serine protease Do